MSSPREDPRPTRRHLPLFQSRGVSTLSDSPKGIKYLLQLFHLTRPSCPGPYFNPQSLPPVYFSPWFLTPLGTGSTNVRCSVFPGSLKEDPLRWWSPIKFGPRVPRTLSPTPYGICHKKELLSIMKKGSVRVLIKG